MGTRRGVDSLTKLIFTCVENACRSQMAEGFARHYGDEDTEVSSGGSNPAEKVNENAVKVMGEKGVDISSHKPSNLDSEDTENADVIVTMGCGSQPCPVPVTGEIVEWEIEDPAGGSLEEFREVRDEIEKRVLKLLEDIR